MCSLSNVITLPLLSARRSKLDTDVRKIASWQVEENITEEVLDKKINELVASRGRKNTDPREVLRKLEVLSKSARPLGEICITFLDILCIFYGSSSRKAIHFISNCLSSTFCLSGARKEIPVLMHLISAMFDSQRGTHTQPDAEHLQSGNSSTINLVIVINLFPSYILMPTPLPFLPVIDDYMDLQQWRTCYRSLFRVTSLLRDGKNLVLGEYCMPLPSLSCVLSAACCLGCLCYSLTKQLQCSAVV